MNDRSIPHSANRAWAGGMIVMALCGGAALAPIQASAATRSLVGPYFAAPFKVTRLPYAFGHGASWTVNGDVLSTQFDSAGITQIFRAKPDGSDQRCLTCRSIRGPNGLPQERPQADWIMFESFAEQSVHV